MIKWEVLLLNKVRMNNKYGIYIIKKIMKSNYIINKYIENYLI